MIFENAAHFVENTIMSFPIQDLTYFTITKLYTRNTVMLPWQLNNNSHMAVNRKKNNLYSSHRVPSDWHTRQTTK